jgi:hypothetical protein
MWSPLLISLLLPTPLRLLLLLLLLQGWLKQMGTFLRQKAPHQLVLSGLEGLFGPASPHHLTHNPYTQVHANDCNHASGHDSVHVRLLLVLQANNCQQAAVLQEHASATCGMG